MVLSVVIPVYKVEAYLRKCVESVLGEAVDMEVILVNDCSPDACGDICRQYAGKDSRIVVVDRKENGGLSAARNSGVDVARGDYITFVDSDDFIEPGTFVENVAVLKENPDIDILEYPAHVYFGGKRSEIYTPVDTYSVDAVTAFDCWSARKGYFNCYACNKLFRRGLWDGVRFPERRYYEDIFTIPYVVDRASVMRCSDRGMYYYCDREGSISNSGKEKVLFDFVSADLKLWERLKSSPCFSRLDSDVFYLTVCNWQAALLRAGGEMLLPEYSVSLRKLLSSKIPFATKAKAFASKLLGKNYCRMLSCYLGLRG